MKASLQDRHKNRDHACEFLLTESCDIHQDMVQRRKDSGRVHVCQLLALIVVMTGARLM